MDELTSHKLFKRVRAKLGFWLLSSKSQFDPTGEDGYVSLDRLISTASFRKEDPDVIRDIIHLIVKLESYNFELNEDGDSIRVPLNNPKMICKSLGI